MRFIKLTEEEVGVLFQAIFNEMNCLETIIDNSPSEHFRDVTKARLLIMEHVSKKVMHAKMIDATDVIDHIIENDTV
jgi:hypothetical protein